MPDEIRRRFRLALAGYLILAAFMVAGLWLDNHQTRSIKRTQDALSHDTAELAKAIAGGQTYLCNQIQALQSQVNLIQRNPQTLTIHCFTQQQRYQQIIDSLETH